MEEAIEPSTTEETSQEVTEETTGLLDDATPEEEVSTSKRNRNRSS